MTTKPRYKRRMVLKASVGLCSIILGSTPVAGRSSETRSRHQEHDTISKSSSRRDGVPDVEFNPTDDQAIEQFLHDLARNDRPAEIVEHLSEKQRRAVTEGLRVETVGIVEKTTQHSDENNSGSELSVYGTDTTSHPYWKRATITVEGQNYFGMTLWTFSHEAYWEYDRIGSVSNISSIAYGSTHYPYWSYNGITDSNVSDRGSTFQAFQQGSFEYCPYEIQCIQNANPYVRINGDAYGNVSYSSNYE